MGTGGNRWYLDVSHDFAFGRSGGRVSAFGEDLHEVIGEITSGEIETEDSVGNLKTKKEQNN